jgi:hypothetical protein
LKDRAFMDHSHPADSVTLQKDRICQANMETRFTHGMDALQIFLF